MGFLSKLGVKTNPGDDQNAFNTVFFDLIEDFIVQGWRVLGSGDLNTFENEGQTAGSSGTGSGGGYHLFTFASNPIDTSSPWPAENWGNVDFPNGASWIRIATPADADHYCEFLFQLRFDGNPGDGYNMIWEYCSGSQRFNTGATATERPEVNTGKALHLGTPYTGEAKPEGNDEVTFFAPSGNNRNNLMFYHIGDKEEDYDFLVWTSRGGTAGEGTGEVFCVWGRLRTILNEQRTVVVGGPTDDPDPYVLIASMETTGSATNHEFQNDGLLSYATDAPGPVEDRTQDFNLFGTFPHMIASYGLDEPVTKFAGHYNVAFWPLAFGTAAGLAWEQLGRDRVTENLPELALIPVGRADVDTNIVQRFFKGFVKNTKLLRWAATNSPYPYWTRPRGTDPNKPYNDDLEERRIVWGRFSLYWASPLNVDVR